MNIWNENKSQFDTLRDRCQHIAEEGSKFISVLIPSNTCDKQYWKKNKKEPWTHAFFSVLRNKKKTVIRTVIGHNGDKVLTRRIKIVAVCNKKHKRTHVF